MPIAHAGQDWWPFERIMIPLEKVVVERFDGTSGFQRSFSEKFVSEAVRNFDAVRFDAIKIARISDGPLYDPAAELWSNIDGQHRQGMAQALDIAIVPADAYIHDMDYEQRALEFYRLNQARQRVSIPDGTRALVEGRDEETLGLLYLLERHGFYLTGFKPSHLNGHKPLFAMGALRRAYAVNSNALDDVLHVLAPWRGVLSRRHEKIVIGGLMFMCRRDDVDLARLRRILEEHGPVALMRDAGEEAAKGGRNVTARAMANALRLRYNHGKRQGRIEDAF